MTASDDPRAVATRAQALDAALAILRAEGVTAVTHASVSKATGIARSTLYRHWPDAKGLRNDAFKRAARSPKAVPETDGPLRADLKRLLTFLVMALTETPWGGIVPQVVASAATDAEARAVIDGFMTDRIAGVGEVFAAAQARGELSPDAPVRHLVEASIAVPYFRKLIAGLPLDEAWLDAHVDLICRLAQTPPGD